MCGCNNYEKFIIGEDFIIPFSWKDTSGTAKNLSQWTTKTAKIAEGVGVEALATCTGVLSVDNLSIVFTFTAAQTLNLDPDTEYVVEIELVSSSQTRKFHVSAYSTNTITVSN